MSRQSSDFFAVWLGCYLYVDDDTRPILEAIKQKCNSRDYGSLQFVLEMVSSFFTDNYYEELPSDRRRFFNYLRQFIYMFLDSSYNDPVSGSIWTVDGVRLIN